MRGGAVRHINATSSGVRPYAAFTRSDSARSCCTDSASRRAIGRHELVGTEPERIAQRIWDRLDTMAVTIPIR